MRMRHNIHYWFIHQIFWNFSHHSILQMDKLGIYTGPSKSIPKLYHPYRAWLIAKGHRLIYHPFFSYNTLIWSLAFVLDSSSSTSSPVKNLPLPSSFLIPPPATSLAIPQDLSVHHSNSSWTSFIYPVTVATRYPSSVLMKVVSFLINIFYKTLYLPWVHCQKHWFLCLISQR